MVMFDQCRIPVANRIGVEGQGFKIAMSGLDGGRLNIAACSFGGAQFCLDRTVSYMKERSSSARGLRIFRRSVSALPTMRPRSRRRVSCCTARRARSIGGSPRATRLAAMAKRLATDIGFEVVNGCLQLHGGYGYLRDHPIERVLRDLRVHQILEGTNEVMRLIISRDILGN